VAFRASGVIKASLIVSTIIALGIVSKIAKGMLFSRELPKIYKTNALFLPQFSVQ
jgi:hypothetical protein